MLGLSNLKLSNLKVVGPSLTIEKRSVSKKENQYLPDCKDYIKVLKCQHQLQSTEEASHMTQCQLCMC